MDSKLQTDFNTWLDTILKEIDQIPPAWNFNLYEPFCVELIGAKSYHKKDKDWANKKYRTRKTKVTIEQINDLPLFKVCAWLVVYAGYELIDNSVFANDFQKYMVNKKQPTDMELTAMRKLLFESMDKKKIKL